ncbi:MAG: hypothetical protein ACFB4J_05755 [Elainellaceae cyanobacterium]
MGRSRIAVLHIEYAGSDRDCEGLILSFQRAIATLQRCTLNMQTAIATVGMAQAFW